MDRELTQLGGIHRLSKFRVSPTGNHLLYTDETDSVVLFDLEKQEKTSLANLKEIQNHTWATEAIDDVYGFSMDGTAAWTLFQTHSMKVRNFLKNKTVILPLITKEEIFMHTSISEDHSTFFSMSIPKSFIERAQRMEEEIKQKKLTREEAQRRQEELIKQIPTNINILDMRNLETTTYPLDFQLIQQCTTLRDDMVAVTTREDGSTYIKHLNNQNSSPIEIFEPIEGIQIVSMLDELNSTGKGPFRFANCMFLDKNTVIIIDQEKEQLILRRIREKEQFIIKNNTLSFDHPRDFFNIFYYPFFIQSSGEGTWAYHIPSGQTQNLTEHFIRVGKGGQLAIELVSTDEERKNRISVVYHPFNPVKKRTLLEWDLNEIKHISFNEDKSLSFIGTIFGDLFTVNVETGHIKRQFFGQQFRGLKVSDSGSTFLLEHIAEGNTDYKVHRIREKCVEPISPPSENMESQLQEFAELNDPADDSFLAFLTGILQEEKIVEEHSELIQPLLWKVFLHYPHLYLDLNFRYPSLKSLPPFPVSLIEDQENQSLMRKSLLSIFEMQTQFRYTSSAHWEFIRTLKPILYVLSEEEQNFYIEKITESISNEATKRIALFQDVFQSKLFYIIYSHVKSWFGRNYEPVSDITIVRNKNSFQTLILSSEPIQNHPSIETSYGIHYAVIEDFSMALNPNEVEAGSELINNSLEWSIHTGNSYRAHLQINIQDQHITPLITRKSGPDYENIWKDQKMTGLIIIGSSLRSLSKDIVENYFSYFEEQGFQFSDISVPDFQFFLKEKISNCEVDYFLKESHSDGDERNVFRFDRVNIVLEGTRQTETGQTEVVYLAFPPPLFPGERETLLFSNLELAELIKQREDKGCGEITYFNTSCWSHVKARYEIESVNSSLLLNIPSKSLSYTFVNREGDAIRELIQAYRNESDFDGFRKSLKKNEGYQSGKVNQYMFPDERKYHDSIFQHISIPLKIQIHLEREENGIWIPISPDEAL